MNYRKIYFNIVNKQRVYNPEEYTEIHHIIPRSLGGSNKKENLVYLTAREHFLCHYLLTKMYPKDSTSYYKMLCAFSMMKCSSLNQDRYFNSKLYEHNRKRYSLEVSKRQKGSNNTQYGTMWICNIKEKINKKVPNTDTVNYPWLKGRNIWKVLEKRQIAENKKNKENEETKLFYIGLYEKFIDLGYTSTEKFCADGHYNKSRRNLSRQFKKYIKEYGR